MDQRPRVTKRSSANVLAFAGAASIAAVGACGGDASNARSETNQCQTQALHGPGVVDVSTSTQTGARSPQAAVGLLAIPVPNSPAERCTGTVIQRIGRNGGSTILTAAHCFCNAAGGIDQPAGN